MKRISILYFALSLFSLNGFSAEQDDIDILAIHRELEMIAQDSTSTPVKVKEYNPFEKTLAGARFLSYEVTDDGNSLMWIDESTIGPDYCCSVEPCPGVPGVWNIWIGNGDKDCYYIVKDERIYLVKSSSEWAEYIRVQYYPDTDLMAALWRNGKIESHHPSELESWPVTPPQQYDFKEETPIFHLVQLDSTPEFTSGDINTWLNRKIENGYFMNLDNLMGSYFLKLVISEDGELKDIVFPDNLKDENAQRRFKYVLESMPRWKPAIKDNEKVRCFYPIQVIFNVEPVAAGI